MSSAQGTHDMKTVGTASATPGERSVGYLPFGEAPTGESLSLPVTVINGATAGETLYIQALSDGDELNGVGVITQVAPQIDPATLTGTVVIVGIVNHFGFQANEHRNPIDDTKINRTYPGDPEGSSSERIAAATYAHAKKADYILDLHQGSTSRMINECRVRCGSGHQMHAECLELAKVFDCGFVFDQKGPDGQLARAAPDDGIPTIDPELGGSIGWDWDSIEIGVQGVRNVLTHYGFIEGSVSPQPQIRAKSFDQYRASTGGFIEFDAELGDQVEAGDRLYRILSPFGESRVDVTAERGGIFWRTRRLPQVTTGEYICSIGTTIDEY